MHPSGDQRRRQLASQFTSVRFAPIDSLRHVTARSNPDLPTVYLEDYNSRCDICLGDFVVPTNAEEGAASERLSQLRCSHVFHTECIERWAFPTDSGSDDSYDEPTLNDRCPSCRSSLWPDVIPDQRAPEISASIIPHLSVTPYSLPRSMERARTISPPNAEAMPLPPEGHRQLETRTAQQRQEEGCTLPHFKRMCPNLGRIIQRLWK